MAIPMGDERTICHTPTPGKKPTSIPTWKYNAIREAILKIVPIGESSIAAKDLPDLIKLELDSEIQANLGSITWHTTTVRLNMEVLGELCRLPRVKPLHITRV